MYIGAAGLPSLLPISLLWYYRKHWEHKEKKKSKNIELPAAVKTIRNAVMFSPLIALGFLDVEPKGKKKGKAENMALIGLKTI